MRMYHPELDYTRKHGQEVSEAAFRLAWEPVGWLEWPPVVDDAEDEEE